MGHMIEAIALERGHEIVGVIDPTLSISSQPSVIRFDSDEFRSADVAIEFTTPATAKENILRAWAQGVPVVSGSTGWKVEECTILSPEGHDYLTESHFHNLENFAKSSYELKEEKGQKRVYIDGKLMLVWSSNFSVGVNIFFELNKELAGVMAKQPQYTPSIKEIHHIHKLDAPSGTAKTLKEAISHQLSAVSVPIESIREGEVPGTHIVTWDSPEDTIVLTHIAKGRGGFALGAVIAAEETAAQRH